MGDVSFHTFTAVALTGTVTGDAEINGYFTRNVITVSVEKDDNITSVTLASPADTETNNIGVTDNKDGTYKVAYGAQVEITTVTASGYVLNTITVNGGEDLTDGTPTHEGLVYTYTHTFTESTTTKVAVTSKANDATPYKVYAYYQNIAQNDYNQEEVKNADGAI